MDTQCALWAQHIRISSSLTSDMYVHCTERHAGCMFDICYKYKFTSSVPEQGYGAEAAAAV